MFLPVLLLSFFMAVESADVLCVWAATPQNLSDVTRSIAAAALVNQSLVEVLASFPLGASRSLPLCCFRIALKGVSCSADQHAHQQLLAAGTVASLTGSAPIRIAELIPCATPTAVCENRNSGGLPVVALVVPLVAAVALAVAASALLFYCLRHRKRADIAVEESHLLSTTLRSSNSMRLGAASSGVTASRTIIKNDFITSIEVAARCFRLPPHVLSALDSANIRSLQQLDSASIKRLDVDEDARRKLRYMEALACCPV